MQKFWF